MSTTRTAELGDMIQAAATAELACREGQPMPSDGMYQRIVAEFCEKIGETARPRIAWPVGTTAKPSINRPPRNQSV